MILVIKGIFTYFLVAPLGIGVSNSNGGKNEADALFEGGFYSRAASNTDDTVYIGKWINAKLQSSR